MSLPKQACKATGQSQKPGFVYAPIQSTGRISQARDDRNHHPKRAEAHGKACGDSRRTLVWTDGRVELHAVAAVDMLLPLLVPPGYAEGNHALRLHEASLKAFQSSSQRTVNKSAEGWA